MARIVTGLPLFAFALWLTYLMLKPILGDRPLTRPR